MTPEYTYKDVGFDSLLNRADLGSAGLPELSNGYSSLEGGSYNGTTDLVGDSTSPSDLESGEFVEHLIIATDGNIRGGATNFDEGTGIWLGHDPSDGLYKLFVGNSAGNKLTWNGTILSITGTIVASAGSIGGFDIGSDYIRDAANTFGLVSTVSGSDDVRFWAGASFDNRTTAPARITESGVAFFSDVTVAGTIRTSVFEKDAISSVGGQLVVANSDVLDIVMTALDSSTLTIKGETTFAVNDILHLKNGTDEEYLRVTSVASAPTYSVTRDLAGAYSANNNPAWAPGTAVVVEGSSNGVATYSGGYLRLLGSGSNSPRYSVFKRTGVAYNSVTEYIGLGNLNGLLDYVSEDYGIAIGTTDSGYLSYDETNGLRVSGNLANQIVVEAGEDLTANDCVCFPSFGVEKNVATHDARVLESASGTNYGTDATAVIGSTDATDTGKSRLYIKFDVSNSTDDAAAFTYLRLTVDSVSGALGDDYEFLIHTVDGADWDESTITWTNKPSFDATELDSWEACQTFAFTEDFTEEDAGQHYVFLNISSLYRDWKDGGADNFGVIVRLVARATGAEAAASIINVTIRTSEHATAASRPTLIIMGLPSNSNKVVKANNSDLETSFGPIGICKNTVSSGGDAIVQLAGFVDDVDPEGIIESFNNGAEVFIGGTAGKLTNIPPSGTTSFLRKVGVAIWDGNVSFTSFTNRVLLQENNYKKLSTDITITANDSNGVEVNNKFIVPLGFHATKITFVGVVTDNGAEVAYAHGVYTNTTSDAGVSVSTAGPLFNNGLLFNYTAALGNTQIFLQPSSISLNFVEFSFRLRDEDASFQEKGIKGTLYFEG